MDTIILSRNRDRMYTAFITPDGRGILNIAVSGTPVPGYVSIILDEQQQAVMARDDASSTALASVLAGSGPRLATPLPTPSMTVPVSGFLRAA